ncbi:MAG: dephospho-CoA kinase [Peptoniphilaceae bacterium]|uniref:dephospho-CoA kinase n=1 Tax=Aedoeadaptatus acetigenes TaxID=2981723 RepID=UPI0011DD4D1A|nr:dephospho-CoA kinase [Aedoeadaptatus acetigenes]MBS6525278.1 dephospho-CoA kinase [Peptoniphilaceae bacterium]MCU6785814.1 dephospho-CoA kinase [Aedoeadaptatus acetigenes]
MKQNKIGITGSIASGKSVLTAYLLGLGFPVIDADAIARDLVHPGSETLKEIADIFGEDMILSDGNLDRDKLGKRVFSDEDARNRLNDIMHPAIVRAMLDLSENFHGLVFYDVPLLFEQIDDIKESGLEFDAIWLVDADEDVQLARLMARDGIDEAYAKEKIASQMPLEEKKKLATVVFDNSGDLMNLYNQVDDALEALPGENM